METFSALLAICAGNSPVPGEFLAQRPVTRNFDVFFDLRLNKRLGKQSWGWWFETPSRPLWRHRNVLHCAHMNVNNKIYQWLPDALYQTHSCSYDINVFWHKYLAGEKYRCMCIRAKVWLDAMLRPRQDGWHFADDIFKRIFLGDKSSYFDSEFLDLCSQGSSWQQFIIVSGNGMAPNRPQAITWINDGLLCGCIYAIPAFNVWRGSR